MEPHTVQPATADPVTGPAGRVLAYYEQESRGEWPALPLGGLKLSAFRAARDQLVRAGRLVLTRNGRYVPTGQAGQA